VGDPHVNRSRRGDRRSLAAWLTLIALTVAVVVGALIGPPLLLWWLTR
jgi:uncharacterized Tic20 family protein